MIEKFWNKTKQVLTVAWEALKSVFWGMAFFTMAALMALAMVIIPIASFVVFILLAGAVWGAIFALLFWAAPETMITLRDFVHFPVKDPFYAGFTVGIVIVLLRAVFARGQHTVVTRNE
jgi:hypothetical protein